ncbi:unnamed protein product [Hymenolepis diminuta]|uniref:Inhibitor_I29 domain-containing protein n=1 Tax=Hymenolepis diminuta TaxID=6216 RepID=A0A564YKX3_HYMDI|nr:unnamed protein product [Hymenolepis diminuta]
MKSGKIPIFLFAVLTVSVCFVESRRLNEISNEEMEDMPSIEELFHFLKKFTHKTKRFAVANAWDDFEDYKKRSGYVYSR